MADSIRLLIECERQAKKRLQEAESAQASVQSQAIHDAEVHLAGLRAEKEEELEKTKMESQSSFAELNKKMETQYIKSEREFVARDMEDIVQKIADCITGHKNGR
ncbi:hypothetical protein PAPHI01_0508 [Pancytospora philotis]|nr:hypothetical protein PAPHI01_0508 [Pancytospora philotis]